MVRKWKIDRDDRENFTMRACRRIAQGEEIIHEAPLVKLQTDLMVTHDDHRFFNLNLRRNGGRAMQNEVQEITKTQKTAFHGLRNGHDTARAFSTNAFRAEVDKGANSYVVYRVQKDISRINHSCRPNAIYQYHSGRKVGTVHALEQINVGEEILIEYLPNTDFAFQSVESRRRDLRQWEFECNCAACQDDSEDEAREDLRLLFQTIENTVPSGGECPDAFHQNMVGTVKRYIDLCKLIGIKDHKLAEGYDYLSKEQEANFEHAKLHYRRTPDQPHCDSCGDDLLPTPHLELASSAAATNVRILVRCYGLRGDAVIEAEERLLTLARMG